MGRTVYSCDDGLTWINDTSADSTEYCATKDCDHTRFTSRGLAFGDGAFYANFGWGEDGSLRRSKNGRDWETLRTDGWGAGVARTSGKTFLDWKGGLITADENTWTSITTPAVSLDHQVYRTDVQGRIIAMSQDGGRFAYSTDGGDNWVTVAAPTWAKDVALNGSLMIAIGTTSPAGSPNVFHAAKSTDGGATWTVTDLGSQSYSRMTRIFYDGSRFVAFQAGAGGPPHVYKSADGTSWTKEQLVTPGYGHFFEGALGFDRQTGTYIMITDKYAAQAAIRSTDGGVTWTKLDSTQFRPGHPMVSVVAGTLDKAICP